MVQFCGARIFNEIIPGNRSKKNKGQKIGVVRNVKLQAGNQHKATHLYPHVDATIDIEVEDFF